MDTTKPDITSLTANKLAITAKATDNDSKIKYYYFSTSSSTPSSYQWNSVSETTSLTKTYTAPYATTIYFHVKDTAGNTNYESIRVSK